METDNRRGMGEAVTTDALVSELPDVADNKWTTPEGAKMAREYVGRTRFDLAMWHLSDYELANAQYLVDRYSLNLGQYQTAAKDRIRWLSVQLALQQMRNNAQADTIERLTKELAGARAELAVTKALVVKMMSIGDEMGTIRHDIKDGKIIWKFDMVLTERKAMMWHAWHEAAMHWNSGGVLGQTYENAIAPYLRALKTEA